MNSRGKDLTGCRIYVGLFPCNECAKAIIQSGITKVIYISDKYADTDAVKASKKMFKSDNKRDFNWLSSNIRTKKSRV